MRSNRHIRYATAVCRLVLAATFILSGLTKVADPWGTALKINEYLSIYGLDGLERASMFFSIWLCGAEMMMGCMLLFKVRIRLVSIFAVGSMLFFTLLTLLSATLIPVEDCGCFGEAIKLSPWGTFLKNLVLLPLALVVWWRYRPDRIFAFSVREAVSTLFFFSLSMGLGLYSVLHLPLIDFLPYRVGVDLRAAVLDGGAEEADDGDAGDMVLVYRNRHTGALQEFALDDVRWQDDSEWEWVETRTGEPHHVMRASVREFALRTAAGDDATEEVLSTPGRLHMLCVTSFEKLPESCRRRLARLVERARKEGAAVVCLTPQRLDAGGLCDFGSGAVPCLNIDASTMLTMLRARYGAVTLDDGVIAVKRNCRDLR